MGVTISQLRTTIAISQREGINVAEVMRVNNLKKEMTYKQGEWLNNELKTMLQEKDAKRWERFMEQKRQEYQYY